MRVLLIKQVLITITSRLTGTSLLLLPLIFLKVARPFFSCVFGVLLCYNIELTLYDLMEKTVLDTANYREEKIFC